MRLSNFHRGARPGFTAAARTAAIAASLLLTGCGAALYGPILAVLATSQKKTTTITSAPDGLPTADQVPAFATLKLSTAPVTITRTSGTANVSSAGPVTLTDFQITGLDFPAGYGESRSNRDVGTTLLATDRILVRVNGDVSHALTFSSADVAVTGTQVAANIQAKVRALTAGTGVGQAAYANFTATFDASTGSYVFTSGSPGETSEVVFEAAPRTQTTDDAPDAVSTATAARLGLGVAQGGIERAGAESIAITILNRGNDVLPSGTEVSLYISHNKVIDTTSVLFDKISTTQAIAVGQARRFTRRNGNAPPVTLIRSDVTAGNYYVLFQVATGREKVTSNNVTASRHPIEVYQPVNDPALTAPPTVDPLDFAIDATSSPISVVTGNPLSASVVLTNLGAPVTQPVPIDIDLVLSADPSLDDPAALEDPSQVLAGIHVNPRSPSQQVTVLINSSASGAITATANGSTLTVSFDGTGGSGVATVQSLTDALNATNLVRAIPNELGSPATDALTALLSAANTAKLVTKDVFVARSSVTFSVTPTIQSTQAFLVGGAIPLTTFDPNLLPIKLFPVVKIRPRLPSGSLPENTLNNVRQGVNFVRVYDRARARFDSTTGATLPTVRDDDFAQLTAVTERPVNTASIRQGQQRVFSFDVPTNGLAFSESQLLVILGATSFDARIDVLNSTGDFVASADDSALGLSPIVYTPVTSRTGNTTFYLVVSAARQDESDLAGGQVTFQLIISVNPRSSTDLSTLGGVSAGNQLDGVKKRFAAADPRVENDVLIPFSLETGRSEVMFVLPERARVRFRSQPVPTAGVNTVITSFTAGTGPAPVIFQSELDINSNGIIYRPQGGDAGTFHILEQGVYTVAFATNSGVPELSNLRLELETLYIPPADQQ